MNVQNDDIKVKKKPFASVSVELALEEKEEVEAAFD